MYKHFLDSVALREIALMLDKEKGLSFLPPRDTVQAHWKPFKKELAQVVVKSAKALGIPAGRLVFNLVVCFITNQTPPKLFIKRKTGNFLWGGETIIVRWNVPQRLLDFCNELYQVSKISHVMFIESVIVWAMNNQKEEN